MKTFIYRYSERVQKKTAEAFASLEPDIREDVEARIGLTYPGGDGQPLAMDVYRPRRGTGRGQKLPVILLVHGGGLFMGDSKMTAGVCQLYAKRGFLVFSLSYRLLTDADACGEIADVCAGFRAARTRLDEFGGDPERVFVSAESAGAYLALYALVLHSCRDFWEKVGCPLSGLRFQGLICFSGMFYTRRADLIGLLYPKQIYGERRSDRSFMEWMNPEHPEILKNLPPVYLVSSDKDFLKKHTLLYEKALKENGVPCRLWYYTGQKELTHAFPALKPWLPESDEVVGLIVEELSVKR